MSLYAVKLLSPCGPYGTRRGMVSHSGASRRLAPAAALLLLSACATVPGQDRLAERDPLEKFNRAMWGVNRTADRIVVRPVTKGYRAVAPKPLRQGVSNFFGNLTEPWSFVNNLLQGKPKRALHNLGRFAVNTTIGLGGLFDRATKGGIKPAPEDLGQTLARWGVNGGPYLVLPLLGPSTLRDAVGSGVAFYADPVNVGIRESGAPRAAKYGYRAAQVISARSDLIETGADAFLDSSLDAYATARSAYLQRHRAAVLDEEDSLDAGPPDEPQPPQEAVPNTGGAPELPSPSPSPVPPESATAPAPPQP